ncbi:MAG TPA: hypothetical protein VHB97_14135, partial [Polyangia bacterium]|nr:hypothetical protein [Polyangia bacterium]
TNDWTTSYVTVNATAVFTLNADGELLRWAKSGGAPLVMQASNNNVSVRCLADAFGYIYFCTDDAGFIQIVRTPEDGGGPATVIVGTYLISDIAFDATHLWYETPHGTFGVPPGGGAGSTISIAPTNASVGPIAVDDAHVFVGTYDGRILVAPKLDGATLTTFANTLQYPAKLRVDGSNLYVLAGEVDADGSHSRITRFATDSSNSTILVDLHGIIGDMAVRGDYVYYSFENDSTVYRICR